MEPQEQEQASPTPGARYMRTLRNKQKQRLQELETIKALTMHLIHYLYGPDGAIFGIMPDEMMGDVPSQIEHIETCLRTFARVQNSLNEGGHTLGSILEEVAAPKKAPRSRKK